MVSRCKDAGMEAFSRAGQFWKPESEDRVVAGSLAFGASGLVLELKDSLVAPEPAALSTVDAGAPTWTEHPVVHGVLTDHGDVTLFEVGGASVTHALGGRRTEVWYPQVAIDGAHVTEDAFDTVRCEFDCLVAWSAPPPLVQGIEDATLDLR